MLTNVITYRVTYFIVGLVILISCRGTSQLEDISRERLVLDRLKLRAIPEEVYEMNYIACLNWLSMFHQRDKHVEMTRKQNKK